MSESRDYLGTIASKKLDNTGVTEDHLRALQKPGTHRLVIMEVVTDEVANTQGGQKKVKLKAGIVEMVPREQEDQAREFMRAIADSRGGDVAIPGTEGQSVDQAAGALAAQVDRDEDGRPTGKGIWDGGTEGPLESPGEVEVKLPEPDGVVPEGDTGLDGDERPWPGDQPDADSAETSGVVSPFQKPGKASKG